MICDSYKMLGLNNKTGTGDNDSLIFLPRALLCCRLKLPLFSLYNLLATQVIGCGVRTLFCLESDISRRPTHYTELLGSNQNISWWDVFHVSELCLRKVHYRIQRVHSPYLHRVPKRQCFLGFLGQWIFIFFLCSSKVLRNYIVLNPCLLSHLQLFQSPLSYLWSLFRLMNEWTH